MHLLSLLLVSPLGFPPASQHARAPAATRELSRDSHKSRSGK